MGGRGSASGFKNKGIYMKVGPDDIKKLNWLPKKELKKAIALEKVLADEYNRIKDSLNHRQIRGIRAYTGNDYKLINNTLSSLDGGKARAGMFDRSLKLGKKENFDDLTVRHAIYRIDTAIADGGYTAPRDMTLLRYADGRFLGLGENATYEDIVARFNDGTPVHAPRYTSVSTRPQRQFGPIRYEIDVKQGAKCGIYIDDISQYRNKQHEFLFSRNSYFDISGVRMSGEEIVVSLKWVSSNPKRIPKQRRRETNGNGSTKS